jgi:beta-phosphoglucomutase-like phosphatase (HAD superfamily)
MARVIKALVFDLDGVLIDSEQVWDEVRESYAGENGGRWHADAQTDMMGMNSREWSRYMHDEIGLRQSPEEISQQVADRVADVYRLKLPLLPGAVETVQRLAERWPLGVASSSNRPVIDLVLELAGLTTCFAVTVSAEEVRHGKPRCAAIEDSQNGILSAASAGMLVIAIPNRRYPPSPKALGAAALVLDSLSDLTPATVESL